MWRSAAVISFGFEVSIVQWLLFPVAVVAGTLMVVQSGCNATWKR
jgi:hypothetical protein